jgi:hypothetical protein
MMAKIKVFYDYHDEGLKPFTMVVSFKARELKWNEQACYIQLDAPFQKQNTEDFSDDVLGCAVWLEDLMINVDKPNTFGVNLMQIRRRLNIEDEANEDEFNFMIRMVDIEEVLQTDIKSFYNWR